MTCKQNVIGNIIILKREFFNAATKKKAIVCVQWTIRQVLWNPSTFLRHSTKKKIEHESETKWEIKGIGIYINCSLTIAIFKLEYKGNM